MADPTPGWRGLDAASRERAYSPSSCIGGHYQAHIQAYAERSRQAHAGPRCQRNLAYGHSASQRLDLFVPESPVRHTVGPTDAGAVQTPGAALPALLVFIHGGYWQELSKDESAFCANAALTQGLAFAAIDYTLAPQASVAAMVAECRQALAWLHQHALSLGFDAQRMVVAGSSAGAHLAAMTALPGAWALATPRAQGSPVRGVVLVSGIYELEPLVGTGINDALDLTVEAARALSPALQDLRGFPPVVVCWGEIETDEFKRQGADFARQLAQAGSACLSFEVPGRNHFDIVLDLADAGTPLGNATLDLMQRL